jgi:formylglycine-generating enzyme required for sulfatase activity
MTQMQETKMKTSVNATAMRSQDCDTMWESKPPPVEKAPAPKPRLEAAERLRPKALAQWLILAAALVLSICGAGAWWYGRGAETKAKDTTQVLAKLNASNDFDTASTGDTRIVDLGSGVNLTLCYCPPGSFIMGSPANEKERSPDEDQVQVTISRGFWLAQTECTQTQWHAVMNNNPSAFQGDNLPVEQVSWHDVQEFMKKLNDNNVLPEGWKWSLPSEAQWEYACRAGTTTPYAGDLELMAWYDANSKKRSHPVETKNGNAWSLHDMHGNIYEWCADGYAERLHGGIDPMYDSSGDSRMLRGGSWNSSMRFCRASDRISCKPDNRANHLGFRAAAVQSN